MHKFERLHHKFKEPQFLLSFDEKMAKKRQQWFYEWVNKLLRINKNLIIFTTLRKY